MFTDMVGYTAMAQRDEEQALELLKEHQGILRPFFRRHNGREISTIGDAFLVEFGSALDAVKCALEIQSDLQRANQQRPMGKEILIRVGIHLGDVIHEGKNVSGDAVNVASRIEPLALPGGVSLTAEVYRSVANKVGCEFESMGNPQLKNVSMPMEVYRVKGLGMSSIGMTLRKEAPPTRIAVLPLVNMSPDPNDEYFADGMTEELIDRLSQVKVLKVIARTSVMSYKKKEKKAAEIARELGVGSLVEGSVRKAGNRVRVTVQLVSAEGEEHVWSSRYDATLEDIFAVQSEIAKKVAGELQVQLLQSEKETLEKRPTENIEAYSAFLRGRELIREGSEPSYRQAVALFERAIELDPSFAKAHAEVAHCHQLLALERYEPVEAMLPILEASVKRAIELDPDLAEVHDALAVLRYNEGDYSGAEAEARKAIELNPSLPDAYWTLGLLAAIKGEVEEATKMLETAYRLDPLRASFIGAVGGAYLYTGREQELLGHLRRTEELAPAETYQIMAEYHLTKGDIEKAREYHAKLAKLRPTDPWVAYTGGIIDAKAGEREKALAAIKKLEEAKMGPLGFNFMAQVFLALGDLDSYFECMDRAVEGPAIVGLYLMAFPVPPKTREDPRYRELVEKFRRLKGLAK